MNKLGLMLIIITFNGNVYCQDNTYIKKWDKSSVNWKTCEDYSSKFHEDNGGKIVFASEKVTRQNVNTLALKNTFPGDAPAIYARVFMETCVKNYPVYDLKMQNPKPEVNKYGYFDVNLLIDNKFIGRIDKNENHNEIIEPTTTTFDIPIVYNASDRFEQQEWILEEFNKLEPGKHIVKLELIGKDYNGKSFTKEPIASGEFELNVVAGKKMKYFISWSAVQTGLKNDALTAQAIKVANEKATAEKWTETFKKAKIVGKEWTIIKNSLGVIQYRTIDFKLYAIFPGNICKMVEVSFEQGYEAGKYSSNLRWGGIGSYDLIDCD